MKSFASTECPAREVQGGGALPDGVNERVSPSALFSSPSLAKEGVRGWSIAYLAQHNLE